MISKLFILIGILFIIPEVLGFLILFFWKEEKHNIVLAFSLGYVIEFAIIQILAVPMIFKKIEYNVLVNSFYISIFVLSIISIILNSFRIKEIIKNAFEKVCKLPKLISILVLAMILINCYMYVGVYTHLDDDDAFYVGTATTSIQTNTMYKYSPTTGSQSGEQNDLRYKLGPFPMFYALVSSASKVPPAIIAHTVLPIIFILVVYSIYYCLGNELFENNLESASLFVLILSIINVFGGYSARTNFSFLLLRIWQGKAVLCNIILPLILVLFLKADKSRFKIISIISLLITVTGSVLTTTMGIALPVIMIGILGFLYSIKNKSFINLIKCFITCMPALVYGAMYFIK